jgi:AraC family transcriptional regulator of adaptative response / DNA-3-methyladenine glycosylase II
LRRLFLQHLGATPIQVALTRRLHFAKKLVDETTLPFEEIAFAAGFGSVRRFNGHIRRTYDRTPTQLRRLARQRASADPESYRFRLAYRPPYDWDAVLAFLAAHATPGVERVEGGRYFRTIAIDDKAGSIEVSRENEGAALTLRVRFPDPRALLSIVERVKRLFDLGADPDAIGKILRADPLLRRQLALHPGVRVPGAWEAFELAVQSLATPQVAGRIAARFGARTPEGVLFPTPTQIANAPRDAVAPAIRALARDFDVAKAGPHVAMRALGEPDAFPSGDRLLRRAAGGLTTRELERRSQAWRPWRAYAAILLWQGGANAMARPGVRGGAPLAAGAT